MKNIRRIIHSVRVEKCNKRIVLGSIVVLKLALMGLFSSDYQDRMFIPFVFSFLNGYNPYEFYYANDLLASFPYLPLMLFIESSGGIILKVFSIKSIFFRNMIFKLPLLIFDCLCYFFVSKIGVSYKYVVAFYFCSPIILYGTYMHGQLDIIPTTFFVAAIYYLMNWKKTDNLPYYIIFLGLSLSTKLHILAAVPILFFYIAKKRDYKSAILCHLLATSIVFLCTITFWGEGFVKTVLLNKEQSVLFTIKFDYGSTQILVPILILILIYFAVYELNYFNRNLLISMLGLLFAVFLICIPPMPAWFIWIVPFVVIYFGCVEEDKHKTMLLYAGFNVLYLFYFIFLHRTQHIDLYFIGRSLQSYKIDDMLVKYVVFTLMAAFLGVVIYKIYKFGVANNSLYQRRGRSFTIGIAGDSGTGKSRLLEMIERLFGTGKDVLFLEGDGDHRWSRGDGHWEEYTALDPQANYLYRQAEDIKRLKVGSYVERSDYDHDTGKITEKQRVTPKKYIVICGLHSLYLPKLRNELDLKIYMDTEDELRKYWKIRRDSDERGYSKDQIISAIEKRYADARKYIYPQKEYADIVIIYFDKTLSDGCVEDYDVVLSVKFEVTIDIDIEPVVNAFRQVGFVPIWKIMDDFMRQELIFNGTDLINHNTDFGEIAENLVPQYEDYFTYAPEWGADVEGVIQLMLLYLISEKMRR